MQLWKVVGGALAARQATRRPATTPAYRLGTTRWLDDKAAGEGWFVDQAG